MIYTVQSVAPDVRTYDANGPKAAYKVRFAEHPDKEVEWSKVASAPAPQPGEKVDGSIDWNGRFGPKFKRDFQQQGGGQSSLAVPKVNGDLGGDRSARIERQHSQSAALQFIAINNAAVQAMQGKKASEALESVVKPIVDWFQRDIQTGVELAEKDGETRRSYGESKFPQPTGVPDVPAPAPQDFQQPPVADTAELPF